jgi:hypothetical protein
MPTSLFIVIFGVSVSSTIFIVRIRSTEFCCRTERLILTVDAHLHALYRLLYCVRVYVSSFFITLVVSLYYKFGSPIIEWVWYIRRSRKLVAVFFVNKENQELTMVIKKTFTQQSTYVKQDSSVTEFTKSQSLSDSTVTTSSGDSSISTDSVKSRTSKQLLEQRAGGQAACVLL